MFKLPLFLKINFLVLALVIVASFIYTLKNYGLSPEVQALLGIDHLPGQSRKATLEWCTPQLTQVEFIHSKPRLEPQQQPITDKKRLSQWQSQFCKTKAQWSQEEGSVDEMDQAIILSFGPDRPPIAISFTDDFKQFSWSHRNFESESFKEALLDLQKSP